MKVYIIKTPEYEIEKFKEVADFLSSVSGPIEFTFSNYEFDKAKFSFLDFKQFDIANPEHQNRLLSTDLFSVCNDYRKKLKIQKNEIVVLITKWRIEHNMLGIINQEKNAIVYAENWQDYTGGVNEKYPICYLILEKIIQCLMNMKMDIDKLFKDKLIISVYSERPYVEHPDEVNLVHARHKGCINDNSTMKRDVFNKLKSPTFCNSCLDKIITENVDLFILKHILSIFYDISSEVAKELNISLVKLIEEKYKSKILPNPMFMIIDKANNIYVRTPSKDIKIELGQIYKTVYLFFLANVEGIRVKELIEHREKLLKLYLKLRPGREEASALKSIESLTKQDGKIFNIYRHEINSIIFEQIKGPVANHYIISGESGEAYSIKLPRDFLEYTI